MADARVSRLATEVVVRPIPEARLTRVSAEVVWRPDFRQARVNRMAAEVIIGPVRASGTVVQSVVIS